MSWNKDRMAVKPSVVSGEDIAIRPPNSGLLEM